MLLSCEIEVWVRGGMCPLTSWVCMGWVQHILVGNNLVKCWDVLRSRDTPWPNWCLDAKIPWEQVYDTKLTVTFYFDYSDTVLLFIQVPQPACCLPLGHSGLYLSTLLSLTLNCLIIFSGLTSWTTDRSLTFAVRERCLEETMPCWICWRQKTSASGSCTPYKELINSMSLILSDRTEVRDAITL